MMTQRKLRTPSQKARHSLHIVRSMSRLERIVSAVCHVLFATAVVLLTVIAFVPWSLCWVWSGACP